MSEAVTAPAAPAAEVVAPPAAPPAVEVERELTTLTRDVSVAAAADVDTNPNPPSTAPPPPTGGVFGRSLTEEEQKLIARRVAEQQASFRAWEEREAKRKVRNGIFCPLHSLFVLDPELFSNKSSRSTSSIIQITNHSSPSSESSSLTSTTTTSLPRRSPPPETRWRPASRPRPLAPRLCRR